MHSLAAFLLVASSAALAPSNRQADHRFEPAGEAAYRARNPTQGFGVKLQPEGIEIVPLTDERAWCLRMTTTHVGRGEELAMLEPGELRGDASRVELVHGGLREWFVHDARGLEQGWIVAAPVDAGSGPLALRVAFEGLHPVARGERVELLGGDGRARLTYGALAAWDADDTPLNARFAVNGAAVTVLVEDTGARYPVTIDPLLSGPHQTLVGPQAASSFGSGLATAGDVNGDGHGDVVVGAPLFDGAFNDEGRAYVYYGTPTGLDPVPGWFYDGGQANAELGATVGFAGDVNGDGFSDILLGAPYFDGAFSNGGLVLLFLGSPSGPSSTPDWSLAGFQGSLFLGGAYTAGDVNGDGYDDVVIGAPWYDGAFTNEGLARVYLGSAGGLGALPAWSTTGGSGGANLGWSISAAGDVDGDGYGDTLVGVPGFAGNAGEVRYFPGSPTGPSLAPTWSITGFATDELGYWVDTAGDVNGDGYADLLMGAPDACISTPGCFQSGAAYVFEGGPTGPVTQSQWIAGGPTSGGRTGSGVATAGDLNGDGFGDVIVGSPEARQGGLARGHVAAYLGGGGGLDYSSVWESYGLGAEEKLGFPVSSAGDVNGDGFGDVVAAAPEVNLVRLFLGGGEPFEDRKGGGTFSRSSNQDFELYGFSSASAGDVDGDGLDDVLIGAPGFSNSRGRAVLYAGPLGVTTPVAWDVEGGQDGAQTGKAVAGVGDVDGDGYDDIAVASPTWDGPVLADEGKVELYPGSGAGPSGTADWTASGGQAGAELGSAVAGAGDLNGDGFADVVVGAQRFDGPHLDGGRIDVWFGAPTGLAGGPDWTFLGDQADGRLGAAVAGAGDVNGDGFDDLLVGASHYDLANADAGRAYLFLGGPAGLPATPSWTDDSGDLNAHFGWGLGGAGDVNGDGFDDVVIGAPDRNVGFGGGTLYVYLGSASGLGPRVEFEVGQSSGRLGVVCGSAGDVNGDGFADVIAGQPMAREALVYYGSPGGLVEPSVYESSLYFALSGGQSVGRSAATAGDVNGDGFADVIVGDPRFANVTSTLTDAGRVQVYLGNRQFDSILYPPGGLLMRPRQLQPVTRAPIALGGRVHSSEEFLVRLELVRAPAGLLWAAPGPVSARLEVEVKPLGAPYDAQGTQLSEPQPVTVGVPLVFELFAQRTGHASRPHRWRARLVFDGNAMQPTTAWVTDRGHSTNDAMLRFEPNGGGKPRRAPQPPRPRGLALGD